MKISHFAALALALATIISGAKAGPLARIYIAPQDAGLVTGAGQQYQVIGEDADGCEVTVPTPITWTANSRAGSITSAGLFTASYTPGRYDGGVTASAPGGFTASANIEVYSNEPKNGYVIERSIGSLSAGEIDSPAAMCIDTYGCMYVLCRNTNVVNRLDPQGRFMSRFSLKDSVSTGKTAMALDSTGNIYVVNASLFRVQKYSPTGTFLIEWGTEGTANGQFKAPRDIAIDSADSVYVADETNQRIQIFSSSGTYLRKIATYSYDGWTRVDPANPRCIAVDGSGFIYLAIGPDYWNMPIQKLDSQGNLVIPISSWFNPCNPEDMALDTTGRLYVLYGDMVKTLDLPGTLVDSIGYFGQWAGQFSGASCIAVDPQHKLYVAEQTNCRIQAFNPDKTIHAVHSSAGLQKGQFKYPCGVVVDGLGNVYVADAGNYRVQGFDSNGGLIRTLASKSAKDSLYACPAGVSKGAGNVIYFTDAIFNRVLAYSSAGALLANWPLPTPADATGIYASPMGLSYDSRGYVWAVESYFNCFRKLNMTGTILATYGSTGTGNGKFNTPVGIALDSSGNLFVTDSGNNRVQKLNSIGTYLSKFGSLGSGNGQLKNPAGICLDASNNIFVADSNNNRIEKFTSSGVYSSQIGTVGYRKYEMWSPNGVYVDTSGGLWVADTYNHRVLKYVPAGTGASVTITSPTSSDTYTASTGPLTIEGTASSSVNTVSWSNDRGATGSCNGTPTGWTASGIALSPGANTIAVTAYDTLGHAVATDSLTVVLEDFAPPTVIIGLPSIEPALAINTSPLLIAGIASDASGIASVTWSNSAGGSGTCSGTTSWDQTVTLQPGTNVITVTAQDTSGLTGTDSITLMCAPGNPKTIAECRRLSDGDLAYISTVSISAEFADCCYIEDTLGFSGIRFDPLFWPGWRHEGLLIDAAGVIGTKPTGERYISGIFNSW